MLCSDCAIVMRSWGAASKPPHACADCNEYNTFQPNKICNDCSENKKPNRCSRCLTKLSKRKATSSRKPAAEKGHGWCGTMEAMFRKDAEKKLGKVPGVTRVIVQRDKIVIYVNDDTVKLPKTFRRRPIKKIVESPHFCSTMDRNRGVKI